MKLRTQLEKPEYNFRIGYKSRIFSLGSCFSVHIAERLELLKYDVFQNPCGITFNPASLLATIKRVESPDSLHESQVIFNQGLYVHPDFHSVFNTTDSAHYISNARAGLERAREFLQKTDVVLLTIGTCYAYRSIHTGAIVNNCHKLPAEQFTLELLPIDQVVELLSELKSMIRSLANNEVHFLFAVSPVRHTKNGLVGDRKSKSIALLAVHEMTKAVDCHYFPSYELLVDDLRDYRFYKEDLIHPTDLAINHVFDLFEESLLDPKELELRNKLASIYKRQQHRALFPESKQHQQFLSQLRLDVSKLIEAYPFLKNRL